MMGGKSTKNVNFTREIDATLDEAIDRATKALATEGFGILTRINFSDKMKEKVQKDIAPTVILGACNPAMAYGAYCKNPDVTSLMPCNVVLSEVSPGRISVQVAKPTALMQIVGDDEISQMAIEADEKLARALEKV